MSLQENDQCQIRNTPGDQMRLSRIILDYDSIDGGTDASRTLRYSLHGAHDNELQKPLDWEPDVSYIINDLVTHPQGSTTYWTCIEGTAPGESPSSDPEKWESYLGFTLRSIEENARQYVSEKTPKIFEGLNRSFIRLRRMSALETSFNVEVGYSSAVKSEEINYTYQFTTSNSQVQKGYAPSIRFVGDDSRANTAAARRHVLGGAIGVDDAGKPIGVQVDISQDLMTVNLTTAPEDITFSDMTAWSSMRNTVNDRRIYYVPDPLGEPDVSISQFARGELRFLGYTLNTGNPRSYIATLQFLIRRNERQIIPIGEYYAGDLDVNGTPTIPSGDIQEYDSGKSYAPEEIIQDISVAGENGVGRSIYMCVEETTPGDTPRGKPRRWNFLAKISHPEWVNTTSYTNGAWVRHNDIIWEAESSTTAGEEPGVSIRWVRAESEIFTYGHDVFTNGYAPQYDTDSTKQYMVGCRMRYAATNRPYKFVNYVQPAPAWNVNGYYSSGSKVQHEGKFWECLSDSHPYGDSGAPPSTPGGPNPTIVKWVEITQNEAIPFPYKGLTADILPAERFCVLD